MIPQTINWVNLEKIEYKVIISILLSTRLAKSLNYKLKVTKIEISTYSNSVSGFGG